MAKLWPAGKSSKIKSFQTVDSGKNKKLPAPKKRKIYTIDAEKNNRGENLKKSIKKLDGFPELLIEKFEDLFNRSSELSADCSKFSKKNISVPFLEIEIEAIELAKKKNIVSSSIETLFQEYLKQNLARQNPRALLLKSESKIIIEKSQKSINECRLLMDEVRQKRKTFHSQNQKDPEKNDLGEDFNENHLQDLEKNDFGEDFDKVLDENHPM